MSQTFADLGVPTPLVSVLAADGKTTAFPIQADTLPDALAGKDVLGRGKTGSGKTIAFALPLVARLGTVLAGGRRRAGRPLALVLAPTRELATQIAATFRPLADAYSLRVSTVFGGVSQNKQVAELKAGVDILVACPGRLEDLMKQGFVSLDAVEITVLDEADHMADLGFLPVVTRIMSATPKDGQRLLFSATLDNGVDKLVTRFLHSPVLHSVDDETSPVEAMTHHVLQVDTPDEKKALVEALASGTSRRILFTRTKHQAKKLAKQLTASGIPAVDLHGNLAQGARDRNLAAFGDGSVKVLVATDVAARGVHVDNVELVVHVDPPAEHKAYLHRSGRTARAGSAGDVVTVMLSSQADDVRTLLRKAAIAVAPQRVTAGSPAVVSLVGDVAPRVAPAPVQPRNAGGGTSQGANAQRKRARRAGGAAAGQGSGAGRNGQGGSGRQGAASGSGQGRIDGAGAQGGGSRRRGRGQRPGGAPAVGGRTGHAEHGASGQRSSASGQRSGKQGASQGGGRASGAVYSTSSSGDGSVRRGRGSRRAQG
ncbi:DEAD/DEAH box helicase [Leifsonia virtsii]|uniref:DEAD/DEAH box helicase n=1 Tax=Leifsonia virtsii TaxID=3035915 RepID=A0ABT8IWW5_9MICO|nr:DEAD/DEAH box helicase [Leifsonia virtsii]MDN4597311.1 DEAD/DEAH box helicase [Leifsonia virtsii]